MEKTRSIEKFCRQKMNWMLENLEKEIGQFNVFRGTYYTGISAKQLPYSRKDFYKISLVSGRNRIYYADKIENGFRFIVANIVASPQRRINASGQPAFDNRVHIKRNGKIVGI